MLAGSPARLCSLLEGEVLPRVAAEAQGGPSPPEPFFDRTLPILLEGSSPEAT